MRWSESLFGAPELGLTASLHAPCIPPQVNLIRADDGFKASFFPGQGPGQAGCFFLVPVSDRSKVKGQVVIVAVLNGKET